MGHYLESGECVERGERGERGTSAPGHYLTHQINRRSPNAPRYIHQENPLPEEDESEEIIIPFTAPGPNPSGGIGLAVPQSVIGISLRG